MILQNLAVTPTGVGMTLWGTDASYGYEIQRDGATVAILPPQPLTGFLFIDFCADDGTTHTYQFRHVKPSGANPGPWFAIGSGKATALDAATIAAAVNDPNSWPQVSTGRNFQGSIIPTPVDSLGISSAGAGSTSGHEYVTFKFANNGVDRLIYRPDGTSFTLPAPANASSGTSTGGNTSTTLNDTGKTWTPSRWIGATITITGGTGSGQHRIISANTATQVTVSAAWSVTPDGTSIYSIDAAAYIPGVWPVLSQVAGGALGARTRFVRICLVKDGLLYSPYALVGTNNESSLAISANNLLKVASPVPPFNSPYGVQAWDGWTVLVGSASNGEVTQPSTISPPLAFGADWTEPSGGATILATGGTPYSGTDWPQAVVFVEKPATTDYYMYPYWDPASAIVRIAFGVGAVSAAAAAAQYGDGMYPLTNGSIKFSTPAAGGSSSANANAGGGGGGNSKLLT